MESSQLTAAPVPIILITKEGQEKEFLGVPFSDRDFDALDNWIKSQVISYARKSLQLEIEEAEELEDKLAVAQAQLNYEEGLRIASKAAISVSLYSADGTDILQTPRGAARVLWQMTRKENPDLKFTDCVPLCRNVTNMNEIMRAFATLNPNDAKAEETKVGVKDDQGN